MALLDYLPVLFFGTAAVLMMRDLYNKMPKYAFACFAAGLINIVMAGFLKASWKLLYSAGICDFHILNTMFLPVNSLGFLLSGLGILIMTAQLRNKLLAAVPPVFTGTFLFVGMMVLGLGAICVCMSVLGARMKKKGVSVLFALSFLFSLGMGYLASRDGTSAAMNWIEQGVNCAAQGMMMIGVLILHRAGLREYKAS